MRLIFGALMLAAVLAVIGSARAEQDAGIKLEYKWLPGEVIHYRITAGEQ